jgi:hypothetical protein
MRILIGLLLAMVVLAACAAPDEYAGADRPPTNDYVPFWNGHHWDWYRP